MCSSGVAQRKGTGLSSAILYIGFVDIHIMYIHMHIYTSERVLLGESLVGLKYSLDLLDGGVVRNCERTWGHWRRYWRVYRGVASQETLNIKGSVVVDRPS